MKANNSRPIMIIFTASEDKAMNNDKVERTLSTVIKY